MNNNCIIKQMAVFLADVLLTAAFLTFLLCFLAIKRLLMLMFLWK